MKNQNWNSVDESQLKISIQSWPEHKAPETLRHRLTLLMQAPGLQIWHLVVSLLLIIVFPPVFARLSRNLSFDLSSTWHISMYIIAGVVAFLLIAAAVVQYMYELESGRRHLPKFFAGYLKK